MVRVQGQGGGRAGLYFSREHSADTDALAGARGFQLYLNVHEMMNFRPVWQAIVVNISLTGVSRTVILAVFVLRERTDAAGVGGAASVWSGLNLMEDAGIPGFLLPSIWITRE